MKSHSTILIILFSLLVIKHSMAQPSTSFYFTTAFPVNEYADLDDEVGYGGNLEFFFKSPSKEKPIGIGFSLSYLGQGLYFYDDPCDCETNIGDNRANNFVNLSMILQVAPTGGTVRPYIETIFGGSYIYSNTNIITPDYASVHLFVDDWAWTYGVGGGFKFLIGQNADESNLIYLDLKGRYLMSSNVDLLNRNSLRYANNQFYNAVEETQINFVAIQVGVILYFR